MAIELQPTIPIPKDPEQLREALNTERQYWLGARAVLHRSAGMDGSAKREAAQCMANLDALLDVYPLGLKRNEAPLLLAA